MKTRHYVLMVMDDIEPELRGPYRSAGKRDRRARELKRRHGDEHGLFRLDVTALGVPEVTAYSGGFFMEDETTCAQQ